MADTFGTGANIGDKTMEEIVCENFKLTPNTIIKTLKLRGVEYKPTAMYGQFGIEDRSWEKTDNAYDLKKYIK